MRLFTIGYSKRSMEEFIGMLREHEDPGAGGRPDVGGQQVQAGVLEESPWRVRCGHPASHTST